MTDKRPYIIDVRDAKEFEKGHAAGSVNIPFPELEEHLDELRNIKTPIVTVCGGGTRNIRAQKFLEEKNINATAGGSWKKVAE